MFQKIMKKITSFFLVAMCIVSLPMPAQAADSTASKMQMAKAEGSVTVFHSSGKTISLKDNMKLYNGYEVDTLEKSYAWIELDGAKLAKLDALSQAVIRKKGKQLEILLKSGNIFFNVSEPLKEDETLNIRTSTMVTGIRGTSGWLEVMDEENVKVAVLEGTVEVSVSNPVTGEAKNNQLNSGETAVCQVSPQAAADGDNDNVGIKRESYSREEIGGFILQEVFADTKLAEKIVEKGGLDLRDLTKEEVDTRVKADEETAHAKMIEVETALEGQVSNISTESIWVKNEESEVVAAIPEPAPNTQTPETPVRQPEPVVEKPPVEEQTVEEKPAVEEKPVEEKPTIEEKQPQPQPQPQPTPQPQPQPAPQPQPQPEPQTPSEPEGTESDPWKVSDPDDSDSFVTAFYADGTLTVSGNGAIRNYDCSPGAPDNRPWKNKLNHILTIKIGDGITKIGNYAFSWMHRITAVEIPRNIKQIGEYAFASSSVISDVSLPAGIETIGLFAFGNSNSPLNIWFEGTSGQWNDLAGQCNESIDHYTKLNVHFEAYPSETAHDCQSRGCSITVSSNDPDSE